MLQFQNINFVYTNPSVASISDGHPSDVEHAYNKVRTKMAYFP